MQCPPLNGAPFFEKAFLHKKGTLLKGGHYFCTFEIASAGFPCRDPIIPSPYSFHGVKICSDSNAFMTVILDQTGRIGVAI